MDYSILIPECIDYYLNGFRKTEYPNCFQQYCQAVQPLLQQMDGADVEKYARELVDWLDAHPGRFFKSRRMADRQSLMLQYTAPAAIKLGREDFAQALSRIWNQRHPAYIFRVGTYEALYKGFCNTLLGFKLPKEED